MVSGLVSGMNKAHPKSDIEISMERASKTPGPQDYNPKTPSSVFGGNFCWGKCGDASVTSVVARLALLRALPLKKLTFVYDRPQYPVLQMMMIISQLE